MSGASNFPLPPPPRPGVLLAGDVSRIAMVVDACCLIGIGAGGDDHDTDTGSFGSSFGRGLVKS